MRTAIESMEAMELEIERNAKIILEQYKVHQSFCNSWTLDIKEKPVGLSVTKYSSLLPDCVCFFKDKITTPRHLHTDICTLSKCTENPR